MASPTVSKARRLLQHVADEVVCKALIGAAARLYVFELRHPRAVAYVRELAEGLHAGYAWGMAVSPPPRLANVIPFVRPAPRDPSWEAVQNRTAQRAAQLRHK